MKSGLAFLRRLVPLIVASLLCVIAFVDTAGAKNNDWHPNSGVRSSDPHLTGPRDMNYDHVIVPGVRIGPVVMGGSVADAVRHLGEPDRVDRSTFRGGGYCCDEVYYSYSSECITFTWEDTGIDPKIERGSRGINVTCDKWMTADGLHVGSTISEVGAHLGQYCPSHRDDGSLIISTKQGIWFEGHDRNSTVSIIRVMPTSTDWGGMCRD